jgi:hypothetical protein
MNTKCNNLGCTHSYSSHRPTKYDIIERLCYNFLAPFLREPYTIWPKQGTSFTLLQESANLLCCIIIIIIKHSLSFLLLPLRNIGHPWNALFHFSFLIPRQSVGLLGRRINPSQGPHLHRHRINAHRHPCLEWDSNPRTQYSSERRFMP